MNKKIMGTLVVTSLFIGVLACVWIIYTRSLTQTEGLLVSVVLTVLSMVASWIASRYYAEASFNRNLWVFALKAAEKVTNLSNELQKLSGYLQQDSTRSYDSPPQALQARDLRIEAAIHVLSTLKSINDGSLSDWQGVLGEEIEARRQEQEEREEDLRDILSRVESILSEEEEPTLAEEIPLSLRDEITSIKSSLRTLASQVSGRPVSYWRPSVKKETILKTCPSCGQNVTFKQRPKTASLKSLPCKSCGTALISRYDGTDFVLSVRQQLHETFHCPSCSESVNVSLDEMPGTSIKLSCPSCNAGLHVFRTSKGIGVKQTTSSKPDVRKLDEELLSKIEREMPPQPWPKGVANEVAARLHVQVSVVRDGVNELIRRGVFKLQVYGKLYVPEPPKL
ncbi:MAG: hypothetical protein HY349_00690 [Nitrospirae bacterium]|nr:hypothetical protein [Nitrospirota bacterium]